MNFNISCNVDIVPPDLAINLKSDIGMCENTNLKNNNENSVR